MKLAGDPRFDALCGEYLLGTLQGAARRRFERALREEPRAALRLRHWQALFPARYTAMMELQPPAKGWRRLERELGLSRYRVPWTRRLAFWRALAAAAAVALIALGALILLPPAAPEMRDIARLEGKPAAVVAALSRDRGLLELRASRPVVAGPSQSYELWLLPAEGGAPVSLAVLGSLDARFPLAPALAPRLRSGARLAVSVEPAGGSPSGAPTGPVVLLGPILL